jgi:sortase A
MKRWIILIVFVLVGIGIIGYPFFAQWYAAQGQERLVDEEAAAVARLTAAQIEAEYQKAVAYNLRLTGEGLVDPFEGDPPTAPSDYLQTLNVAGNSVMASLEVPKLGLTMPVLHGVAEDALQKGIGHIPTTALPVGGAGTHSILVGHRGIPTAKLFTDLDRMVVGDQFYIHVLGHDLAYEVHDIKIVLPYQTEDMQPAEGQDLMSLVTCTPLAINTHRLIVTGHRVPYVAPEPAPFPQNLSASDREMLKIAALAVGVIALAAVAGRGIRRWREKREERKATPA